MIKTKPLTSSQPSLAYLLEERQIEMRCRDVKDLITNETNVYINIMFEEDKYFDIEESNNK